MAVFSHLYTEAPKGTSTHQGTPRDYRDADTWVWKKKILNPNSLLAVESTQDPCGMEEHDR